MHYGLMKEAETQHTEEEDHTAAVLLLTRCGASKRGRGNAEITSLSPVYALNVPYGTVTGQKIKPVLYSCSLSCP